jgi:hypothetical protein
MQDEKNPFDRDPRTTPLMRFILHSNSLEDEILTKDSPANRLVKLNRLNGIEVIPLPTRNAEIRKIFADNGLVITEYHSYDTFVELRLSNGVIHHVKGPFKNRVRDNSWEQFVPGSKVTHADFSASINIGDYLVVGATDQSLKEKVIRDSIITAEQALELVRIMLTYHGRFYIGNKIPINEGYYYLYRFNKLFYLYQYVWTIAAYGEGKGFPENMSNHLFGLGTRLEFICKAYDKIAFFSLVNANHDNQTEQLYHLVYFVMLITGVFDSLAHILNEFYKLGAKKTGIRLRISKDDKDKDDKGQKTSKYYLKLQPKNASLCSLLISKDIQKDINTFYPLRDSLQHRDFFRSVLYQNASEPVKNVIELSKGTTKELKEISASFPYIIWDDPSLLVPFPFIKWAQEFTVQLVNQVLLSIDWDSFCSNLPKDIQDKIHASHEEYKQGLSHLLGWTEEPLYF